MSENALVALPPRRAPIPFSEPAIETAYEVWSERAGRNGNETARILAREAGEGAHTPSPQDINRWARERGWRERSNGEWREQAGDRVEDMRAAALAAFVAGLENLVAAGNGAFDDNPAASIARLKAGELAIRLIERGVIPLSALMAPPGQAITAEDEALTLEQRQARARQHLQTLKGSG